jgi:WD40 repeat protein
MPDDSAPQPTALPPRRRSWGRFSLRTLLIVAPLLAVMLGVGFRWWYPRYLERRAVEEITKLGGAITTDALANKTIVELPGKGITDAELGRLVPHLRNLAKLTDLMLVSNKVSDEGLLLLADIPQLKHVYVADTLITDAGITKLQQLRPNLLVDRRNPHIKAMTLAARPIFKHAILRLALAPDKSEIIAGSGDGKLRVFDLATQEMVRSHVAHDEWAFAVVFHPSGKWLATGGGDNLIKLWSWPELVEVGRFVGHEDDVHGLSFTPNGRQLVSTSDDLTVRIWDVATRELLHRLEGHDDTIPGLAISPDGTLAATASRDKTIRLWSIVTGECVRTLEGHTDDVMAVAFHPSGRELASASYDQSVRLWNLDAKRQPAPPRVLKAGSDWLFSVAYSPEGDALLVAAGDGVRSWDRESGRLLWRSAEQRNVSHAIWLDSGEAATSSADASIAHWQASSGAHLATLWTRFTPEVADLSRMAAR